MTEYMGRSSTYVDMDRLNNCSYQFITFEIAVKANKLELRKR